MIWFQNTLSEIVKRPKKNILLNSLSARIFTVFEHSLLEDRVLHKKAWVSKLLGTHLIIQVHKKVKFSWRDNLLLALKGLKRRAEGRTVPSSVKQKSF